MKTTVSIDRLVIFARHGVLEQEAITGNEFEVSVTVEYDFIAAAERDDVDLTLNYAELTDMVKDAMATPRRLIETVALDIARRIRARWPQAPSGSVTVAKLHPPIERPAPRASVTIAW